MSKLFLVKNWRIIPSWPIYEASEEGEIRHYKTKHIKKPYLSDKGYLYVSLKNHPHTKKKAKLIIVHLLIAETFLGPRPKGFDVHHKDLTKTNNHYKNLEYLESSKHRELHNHLNINNHTKLNPSKVITMRKLRKGGMTLKKLSEIYDVSECLVSQIVRHIKWKNVKERP